MHGAMNMCIYVQRLRVPLHCNPNIGCYHYLVEIVVHVVEEMTRDGRGLAENIRFW